MADILSSNPSMKYDQPDRDLNMNFNPDPDLKLYTKTISQIKC